GPVVDFHAVDTGTAGRRDGAAGLRATGHLPLAADHQEGAVDAELDALLVHACEVDADAIGVVGLVEIHGRGPRLVGVGEAAVSLGHALEDLAGLLRELGEWGIAGLMHGLSPHELNCWGLLKRRPGLRHSPCSAANSSV